MKSNERLQALHCLTTLLKDHVSLSHLLQPNLNLSALTKEICFGVCRHYYRLQAIADSLLKKRPKALEVWVSLLIGLYQLHYMRKPDYAVVKETVALLDKTKKSWAKGLVNAVLRNYCREQEKLLVSLEKETSFRYGHPQWFIDQIQKSWPNNWQNILEANDKHPPMSLRVNKNRDSAKTYLTRLEKAGMTGNLHHYAGQGIELTNPVDVHDLPGFEQGDVSVQDEAAQLAASLLDLKPGLRLLDACCAPGGKTCHILEAEPTLSACFALDIDERRLQRVRANLERLNLQATLLQADALHPKGWWDGQLFDRILLDAPCSATGVIRRHPDIKLLRTPEDISHAVDLQRQLLDALWPLLAPNGLLVYATCSIVPEENEQQIAAFVARHLDSDFIDAEYTWGHATGHGWQILPGENNMDGFFYSVLRKKG